MSMIAVRRSINGPRVRAGVTLHDTDWTLVEDPSETLLNDPNVVILRDVTGEDDPRLHGLIYRAETTPDPEKPEPSEEEIAAYADKHGLAFVKQSELDAFKGMKDRLEKEAADAKAELQTEKDAHEATKKVLKEAKDDHKAELDALEEDHKTAVQKLKDEHKAALEKAKGK